jgi:hypothetical protein
VKALDRTTHLQSEQIKRMQADIAALKLENAEMREHTTPRPSRVFMGSQNFTARTVSRTNKAPHSDLPVQMLSAAL